MDLVGFEPTTSSLQEKHSPIRTTDPTPPPGFEPGTVTLEE